MEDLNLGSPEPLRRAMRSRLFGSGLSAAIHLLLLECATLVALDDPGNGGTTVLRKECHVIICDWIKPPIDVFERTGLSDVSPRIRFEGKSLERNGGACREGVTHRGIFDRWQEGLPFCRSADNAVKESLNWLSRHQNPDGSWSVDGGGLSEECSTSPAETKQTPDFTATVLAVTALEKAGILADTPTCDRVYRNGRRWLESRGGFDGGLQIQASEELLWIRTSDELDALLSTQNSSDPWCEVGSWDPMALPCGARAGRVAVTALKTLALIAERNR